jgi:hypothetical protein
MKRCVALIAALALGLPSYALAEPAAKALSVNNAAVQPIRASARSGKKLKATDDKITAGIVGVLVVLAGVCAAGACSGGKPDSP